MRGSKRKPSTEGQEKVEKKSAVPRHTKSEVWRGFFPSGKLLTPEPIKHHEATKLARKVCMEERCGTSIRIEGRGDRWYKYHKDGPIMRRL